MQCDFVQLIDGIHFARDQKGIPAHFHDNLIKALSDIAKPGSDGRREVDYNEALNVIASFNERPIYLHDLWMHLGQTLAYSIMIPMENKTV